MCFLCFRRRSGSGPNFSASQKAQKHIHFGAKVKVLLCFWQLLEAQKHFHFTSKVNVLFVLSAKYAPASRTRRRRSTVEDPRMGWVGTWPIQSFVLYLSDAFDTDACAPVRSKTIFTFWSMSEMGIRSRGRVGQNRKKNLFCPTLRIGFWWSWGS